MSALDDMIHSLHQLNVKDVEAKVAAKGAETVGVALTATLTAGTSPEGVPWAPRKEGGRAYVNAASRLSTKAYGSLIRATVTGPEVYGHYGAHGTHKGDGGHPNKKNRKPIPARPMLPDAGAGMPLSVEKALTEAARKVFDEATR